MKRFTLAAFVAALAGSLASCTNWESESDVKNAELALTLAEGRTRYGETVNRSELLALPGLEKALDQRARKVKANVAQQLRDPTDPIWGDMWTPDLITTCGTVNGRNAYGAYAGQALFYARDGKTARLQGDPLFKTDEASICYDTADRRLILRGDKPRS
ncbi:hypothetical protein [Brevundimonas aurantiaca]|uniref:hypothetical protein n=1 Tax=Brevundimonas aurantiaca TaxID=74316 RepID=UPI002FDE6C96